MTEPTLRELRAALLVAEAGGFRRAAKQLDMAPSTLSQAMATLERTLGVRLFHRTTRSVALTDEGRLLLDRAAPLIAQLDDVLASAGSEQGVVRGRLRINLPHSAGVYLLQEVVPASLGRFPEVRLELQHEERMVDIVAAGCDAGVRRRSTVGPDMIGVPFGRPLRWVPVASPEYLVQAGTPVHPHDLLSHRCVRTRMPAGERYLWEFERDGEALQLDVPGALTLDRMSLMLEAALQHLGVAYVLEHLARREVAGGRLTVLLADWLPVDAEYMLYYPSGKAQLPSLRVFIDTLRETAAA